MTNKIIDLRRRVKKINFLNDLSLRFNSLCSFYIKNEQKPIFICTSARTGSTWLMQLIASANGLRFINQPLDIDNFHTNRYCMEPKWKFIYASEERKAVLKEYINDLIDGKIALEFPHQIWDDSYELKANRLVFKFVFGLDLIKWLEDTFDPYTIYLVRHPVPTVLSRMKYNWHLSYTKYFLKNEENLKIFPEDIFEFSHEILKNGSKLEKYTLQWCLENYFPLKHFQNNTRLNITYEEMVLNPEFLISHLIKELDFVEDDYERMIQMVTKKARSPMTHEKTEKFLKESSIKDDRSYLIKKWRNEVTEKQENDIFNIVSKFDINIYEKNNFLPKRNLH